MEWVYKANESKIDHVSTLILADRRGFLCRSAYLENGAWVSNVREVKTGDVLHFYYARSGKPAHEFGSFEVILPDVHPRPEVFGDRVEETALYRVKDPGFAEMLTTLDGGGYLRDPVLRDFTGWPFRKVGRAPKYDPRMFTARATLQPYESS